MNFLKGLGLAILSFLLFLSLFILGLAFTLNQTVLNPNFVVQELDKLDVSSLVREWLDEQIPQFGIDASAELYVARVLDDTFTDLEPWIKEQTSTAVYTSYDYLKDKSQSLNLIISLEPVRDTLKQNLREAILNSPPPELKGLPQSVIETYLDEAYRQIDRQLPQAIEIDQATLDPEVVQSLEQVKQAISYFQIGYTALIGFILLLILGIILLNRQVKSTTLSLGITFLTCGAISYIGALVAKSVVESQLTQVDIPTQFQMWLPELLGDFLAPLGIFAIGLMVGGTALITASFIYKRGQPSS